MQKNEETPTGGKERSLNVHARKCSFVLIKRTRLLLLIIVCILISSQCIFDSLCSNMEASKRKLHFTYPSPNFHICFISRENNKDSDDHP